MPSSDRSTDASTTDDSGLHDIRAMAQTTRQRNSRRITTQSPIDDGLLTASSASMRAIALPDPGLSNPSLALPLATPAVPSREMSPSSVPARPSGRLASASIAAPIIAPTAVSSVSASTSMPAVAARPSALEELASLARAKAPKAAPVASKKPYLIGAAVLALGGGVVAFLALRPAPAPVAAPVLAPVVEPLAPSAPAAPAVAAPAPVAVAPTEVAAVAVPAVIDEDKDAKAARTTTTAAIKAPTVEVVDVTPKAAVTAAPAAVVAEAPKAGGNTIDDLLRAAGTEVTNTEDQVRPEKKNLTSGDIKGVMGGFKGKAQGCFEKHGVAGNVGVKLSVSPDGKVKSAAATGSFAGSPTGDCVAKLVSGASFPAWDGASMTVNYTYLLAE